MNVYPRTIRNGIGEEITFLGVTRHGGMERLEIENRVSPGSGPPMHVHHLQEESLTVVRGRMGYEIQGGPPVFLDAGETGTFAAGVPHRFWNAGEEDLVARGWAAPPLNLEYFLTELYGSAERGGGRPDMRELAFLIRRYRSEFGMSAIPDLVQRLVFPLMILWGWLGGRLTRYADAPEPARR
jgi:mannose-6-phosphate isomerase-like protein (cupin superfamily)